MSHTTTARGHAGAGRTNELQQKGRGVQDEEGDVQEVEERLDIRQHLRVLLEPGHRHVDCSCTHADWELWTIGGAQDDQRHELEKKERRTACQLQP